MPLGLLATTFLILGLLIQPLQLAAAQASDTCQSGTKEIPGGGTRDRLAELVVLEAIWTAWPTPGKRSSANQWQGGWATGHKSVRLCH